MPGMARPSRPICPDKLLALKALLGDGGWLDAAADRAPFETDFRGLHHGSTPLVALPDSTARVAELVHYCATAGIAIVPQGGNTSYCGGATPRAGEIGRGSPGRSPVSIQRRRSPAPHPASRR
jgi:hypothetical protein